VRRAFLAGGLLLVACAGEPVVAPEPTPAPELTLCERPARPAANVGDPEVEASFRAFAHGWLEKLRRAGTGREIGREFETELRPTGDTRAPWVGVLRYCERRRGSSAIVTELFRFQAGRWVY
jgi:hypothetical protein